MGLMQITTSTKYFSFADFSESSNKFTLQVRNGFMKLYDKAKTKSSPIIVELGTNKGMSTTVFLQAAKERDGKVFSVDIDSYFSDLTDDTRWTFIHSDSTDADGIVSKFPTLRAGIDILLIDSLHKRAHVEKEFFNWWPYLNEGALIIFDDIDSHNYRPNQPKDSRSAEFDWADIKNFVEEIFYANEDKFLLELHLGSTGFAIMTKACAKGTTLSKKMINPARLNSIVGLSHFKLKKAFAALRGR
jgi:predicted O-methyltransferase YrrM